MRMTRKLAINWTPVKAPFPYSSEHIIASLLATAPSRPSSRAAHRAAHAFRENPRLNFNPSFLRGAGYGPAAFK